jgi:ribosomal protein L37AE/L43A
MTVIDRLRDTYLTLSANHTRRAVKMYRYCPHCAEKTPWMVRVVTGFFRCLQCGNNPLEADAPPRRPGAASASATASDSSVNGSTSSAAA